MEINKGLDTGDLRPFSTVLEEVIKIALNLEVESAVCANGYHCLIYIGARLRYSRKSTI
jgi:hypothetical protein